MKEAIEQYRQERATLENEISDFLEKKFAEFKDKTGAEVIHLEVEFDSTDDEEAEFFISSVFIGTDL
ncbi:MULTISPECIES: hypothetical protein [Acinetobacter]|uniref:Uncharacterized protein n=1 Tax=Acinetobacter higginsii TaxID=70347 RepID=N8XMY3_9GAMM|nr:MULTISPECIES: hypothetical protein [Acinetobacter]ENV08425.1 hypothetical protein F966_03099 [Acinetobacter higginsii]ENX58277.1 hypothetical protein F902_02677 [Acinetobacter higginsii]ENX59989.1 hypothetical protein F885_02181 [Acinetobacter higginsii]MCH7294187.1 hypothetical protein [Acinetobacter higginsii]MCH7304597.1 hypothetical protein [Acinetobacter higginsii]